MTQLIVRQPVSGPLIGPDPQAIECQTAQANLLPFLHRDPEMGQQMFNNVQAHILRCSSCWDRVASLAIEEGFPLREPVL